MLGCAQSGERIRRLDRAQNDCPDCGVVCVFLQRHVGAPQSDPHVRAVALLWPRRCRGSDTCESHSKSVRKASTSRRWRWIGRVSSAERRPRMPRLSGYSPTCRGMHRSRSSPAWSGSLRPAPTSKLSRNTRVMARRISGAFAWEKFEIRLWALHETSMNMQVEAGRYQLTEHGATWGAIAYRDDWTAVGVYGLSVTNSIWVHNGKIASFTSVPRNPIDVQQLGNLWRPGATPEH